MSAVSLYILLVLVLCRVTAEYYFIKQPTDTFTVEGMSLHLQCKVIITSLESKSYSIHWQLNGSAFIEDTHFRYVLDETRYFDRDGVSLTSSLTVNAVSRQNEASYRCKLYSATETTVTSSNEAKVTVIPKPRFSREPGNISAIEGKIATLKCSIEAVDSTLMSVIWTRENLDVDTSQNNIISSEYKGYDDRYAITGDDDVLAYHLKILEVKRNDTGIFQCSVHLKTSGKVILKSRKVMLDVLYPPDQKFPLCSVSESKKYSEGDNLTTNCMSRGGNGPLRLSWIRNGEEINGTRVANKDPDIRDMWTLTHADNGGNITCAMEGKALLNKRHCVIGPLSVYFGPKISMEPKTMQVFVGQSVSFKCSVYANPPIMATYAWFLDGEQLDNSNADLEINWFEIEKHIASTKSEINVMCAADVTNSRISDSVAVKINLKQSMSTEPTASPEIQEELSNLTVYTVIGVSCFFLVTVIVPSLVFIYVCRTKKVNNNKPHTINDPSREIRTFQRGDIGCEVQTLAGDNDIDECSLTSSDVDESTRPNSNEEPTAHEYENIVWRQVGHIYQSLTSRSNDTYMKLNHLTRIKHR